MDQYDAAEETLLRLREERRRELEETTTVFAATLRYEVRVTVHPLGEEIIRAAHGDPVARTAVANYERRERTTAMIVDTLRFWMLSFCSRRRPLAEQLGAWGRYVDRQGEDVAERLYRMVWPVWYRHRHPGTHAPPAPGKPIERQRTIGGEPTLPPTPEKTMRPTGEPPPAAPVPTAPEREPRHPTPAQPEPDTDVQKALEALEEFFRPTRRESYPDPGPTTRADGGPRVPTELLDNYDRDIGHWLWATLGANLRDIGVQILRSADKDPDAVGDTRGVHSTAQHKRPAHHRHHRVPWGLRPRPADERTDQGMEPVVRDRARRDRREGLARRVAAPHRRALCPRPRGGRARRATAGTATGTHEAPTPGATDSVRPRAGALTRAQPPVCSSPSSRWPAAESPELLGGRHAPEPNRTVFRRPLCSSHEADAVCLRWPWHFASASAGRRFAMASRIRRPWNRSTRSRDSDSTAAKPRHGPRGRIAPFFVEPDDQPFRASTESPTLPTDGSTSASARRSAKRMKRTCEPCRNCGTGRCEYPPNSRMAPARAAERRVGVNRARHPSDHDASRRRR